MHTAWAMQHCCEARPIVIVSHRQERDGGLLRAVPGALQRQVLSHASPPLLALLLLPIASRLLHLLGAAFRLCCHRGRRRAHLLPHIVPQLVIVPCDSPHGLVVGLHLVAEGPRQGGGAGGGGRVTKRRRTTEGGNASTAAIVAAARSMVPMQLCVS